MKFSAILLLFLTFSFSCIRFKLNELKENTISRIQIGEGINKIEAEIVNNTLTNIPLQVPVTADRIFVTDLKNSLIKVFLKNGKLDYIIGTPKNLDDKVRSLNLKISNPGIISVSIDDDIYIQNRVNPGKDDAPETIDPFKVNSGYFAFREPVYIPSYIIHISGSKEKTSVIGISGKDSEPFRYIESIQTGEEGRLFVTHREAEEMILSYYRKGKLLGVVSESKLEIFSSEDASEYFIKLEKMIPEHSGTFALVSFSFTGKKDNRFKFRRVYKYKYNSGNSVALLKEFQDPSEVLFGIKNNKEFYIWETENSEDSVKLKVHDSDGNHTSNQKITFPPPRTIWRETYLGYKDNIYSVKIKSGYLEVVEWK